MWTSISATENERIMKNVALLEPFLDISDANFISASRHRWPLLTCMSSLMPISCLCLCPDANFLSTSVHWCQHLANLPAYANFITVSLHWCQLHTCISPLMTTSSTYLAADTNFISAYLHWWQLHLHISLMIPTSYLHLSTDANFIYISHCWYQLHICIHPLMQTSFTYLAADTNFISVSIHWCQLHNRLSPLMPTSHPYLSPDVSCNSSFLQIMGSTPLKPMSYSVTMSSQLHITSLRTEARFISIFITDVNFQPGLMSEVQIPISPWKRSSLLCTMRNASNMRPT